MITHFVVLKTMSFGSLRPYVFVLSDGLLLLYLCPGLGIFVLPLCLLLIFLFCDDVELLLVLQPKELFLCCGPTAPLLSPLLR